MTLSDIKEKILKNNSKKRDVEEVKLSLDHSLSGGRVNTLVEKSSPRNME